MFLRTSFWTSSRGYSLFEMFTILAIISIGSAVAIPVTMQMVRSAKADSALSMTTTFLMTARNRAIAERRNIVLTFHESSIEAFRIEVPTNVQTLVDTLTLEDGYEFLRDDLPNTPDRFGIAAGDEIDFTGPEPVMFTSDGSLIDDEGDVTNGVLFMMKDGGTLNDGRAVAVWGSTGLVRGWKWGGSEWIQ